MTKTSEKPPRLTGFVEAAMVAAIAGGLSFLAAGEPRAAPAPVRLTGLYRGRGARSPAGIPARGWRDILRRTWTGFNDDHIVVIAGGVTFSVLLSIFPALAAFVALYGLVADVDRIPHQLQMLSAVLPSATVKFMGGEMLRLAHTRHGGLSLAAVLGVLLSLWSANGAMKALFIGMNVAYERDERRGIVKLNIMTLTFTLGLVVFLALTFAALAADAVVARLAGPEAGVLVAFARWPLLLVAFGFGLALLYRYAPCRAHTRWRWISWGSGAATVSWLTASLLFSFYTSRFSHYDKTYGSLGAVVGLMVWIWISAIVVLTGAELNAEIERQAAPAG